MRIVIEKADRKSIAYSLEPQKLTVLIPKDVITGLLEKTLSVANRTLMNNEETIPRKEFYHMLNNWTEKLQVKPKKIQLKSMKSKWASCSQSKTVMFNSSITSMPKEFVEYVVCHELLHFKVPKHNKLFRNLLSAYMPDWQERISRTIDYVLAQNNGKKLSELHIV